MTPDPTVLDIMCDDLAAMRTENNEAHSAILVRISALEKWRAMLIGGGVVLGWALSGLVKYL